MVCLRFSDSEYESLKSQLAELEESGRKVSLSNFLRLQIFSYSGDRIRMIYSDIRSMRSEIHFFLNRMEDGRDLSDPDFIVLLKRYDSKLLELKKEVEKLNGCYCSEKSEGE